MLTTPSLYGMQLLQTRLDQDIIGTKEGNWYFHLLNLMLFILIVVVIFLFIRSRRK